jgi:hypothetical protein
MPCHKRYSFGQNLQPTQSNYASQVILLCAFGTCCNSHAIMTGMLGNTAHNILRLASSSEQNWDNNI